MPATSNVHIDAALTNVSVKYKNAELVGKRLFPVVPVKKQSDRYYVIGKEAYRLDNDLRRPGTRAKAVDFSLSDSPYYCDGHGLTYDVPDEVRENADVAIQPEIEGTEFLTDKIELNREKDIADRVRNAANYPADNKMTLAGASQWSDYSGTSDPIADFKAMKQPVFEGTWGREANIAIISYPVWLALKDHPAIIERIKYSERGVVTLEILKELLEIDELIVGKAVYNSAAPGADPVQSYIWGKDVVIAHRPKAAALREISLGYSFQWAKPSTEQGVVVTRWREEPRKTDVLMVETYYDNRIVVAGAGALIQNAVA